MSVRPVMLNKKNLASGTQLLLYVVHRQYHHGDIQYYRDGKGRATIPLHCINQGESQKLGLTIEVVKFGGTVRTTGETDP